MRTEGFDIAYEPIKIRIDNRIRPIGGDNATLPSAVADPAVMGQVIKRAFRGRENL